MLSDLPLNKKLNLVKNLLKDFNQKIKPRLNTSKFLDKNWKKH